MSIDSEVDASFYNLVHKLIDADQSEATLERRESPRRPFASTQRIAIRRGDEVPTESDFVEVRCHDLTRQGFSFFLPTQPDFTSLVAALESSPKPIYLAAEVVRCSAVLVYSSGIVERMDHPTDSEDPDVDYESLRGQTATPMVLVGCRFTERLHR